jgi:hypothetical protein
MAAGVKKVKNKAMRKKADMQARTPWCKTEGFRGTP